MTPAFPKLDTLRANPDWASLPLFDRKGWSRVRFGDVVENVNETERAPLEAGIDRFIGLEHLVPQDLHIRSWGNVADGTTFTRRCRPGQVLFGKRRAYQRKVAVAEFDAVVSGDIYVLVPKDKRLLPELLPFLCMSDRFFEHAVGTSAGSLSPRTNWKSLANFEFDLPPLEQQRRLANILWAIDQTAVEWGKVAERAEEAHESWISDALSRTGRDTPISELGEIVTGVTPKTKVREYYNPPSRLFVSPADINQSRYVNVTEKRISDAGLMFGRPIPKDAIMVVCIGSTIGKVAMASERCLTNQQINSVICSDRNPSVVYCMLRRSASLFKQNASCTAVPILNKGAFSSLRIEYPSDQEEEFQSKIEEHDILITSIGNHIEFCSESLKVMLNAIFR